LQMELAFKLSILVYYTEYIYTETKLSKIEIYSDNGKLTKLFTKDITYTDGVLTQTVLTRESDSQTMTTVYAYESGVIKSKTRS
jgi:hypothetical protein